MQTLVAVVKAATRYRKSEDGCWAPVSEPTKHGALKYTFALSLPVVIAMAWWVQLSAH